jgi:hypothetical protein
LKSQIRDFQQRVEPSMNMNVRQRYLVIHFSSSLRLLVLLSLTIIAMLNCPATAWARITRIVIDERQSPAYDGKSFGNVGQYERLVGRAFGEIDPKHKGNTIITDLQLAPRNARGMVEYVATFSLLKPINMTKASGLLIYSVPNRGNKLLMSAFNVGGDPGDGFFFKHGDCILFSGWQGDVLPRPGAEILSAPVARNVDGSSITGTALARFVNMPAGTNTLSLPVAHTAASLDTRQAILTRRAAEDGAVFPIASSDWAFADCRTVPFPGTPDPERICLKGGFDSAYLYELTYTAKDPPVLGIGLAATRDIISFFRRESKDSSDQVNPIGGGISHVIAQGISQAGNFIKTFIHLGFNQDESGRMVWDGANDHIAGRQLPINFRFAIPGGAANPYEPGSEAVLWWSRYPDEGRNRKPAGMLDRCLASRTCPKIFETFGSAEFWGLRMSPGLVGTKATQDIPLPPNVRRYYFPGTTHGGGRGGFSLSAGISVSCQLPDNPNPQLETMRALMVSLTNWVVRNTVPPASKFPRLADSQLVHPNHTAIGFPPIPGVPFPDNLLNSFLDYDFGADFNYADLSGRISRQPPVIRQILPSLVPKVDADGNEIGGIPSVLHQAPLGTYLGWNVTRDGFYKGKGCGFSGGYIPFARTKAERLAMGDPRLSLEERYRNHDGYVTAVRIAADRLVKQRFLLAEDAERLIRQAETSDILR